LRVDLDAVDLADIDAQVLHRRITFSPATDSWITAW
jgi:hypothetical protein